MIGKSNLLTYIKSATSLLIVLTLLSKLMGFVRELVISYHMGVSASYEDMLLALTIPTVIISVMHYTIPHSVIPRLTNLGQKSDYDQIVLNIIRKIGFTFIILSVMYFFAAGYTTNHLTVEISAERKSNVQLISKYLSLYLLLALLYEIFYALLQSEKKFSAPVVIGLAAQLIIIISVGIFTESYGEKSLLYGLLIGAALQFALIIVYYKKVNNFKYFSKIRIDFPLLDKAFLFVFLIELVGQLSGYIDRFFASQLETGRISALNYAGTLMTLPTSIFIYSIGTVFFLKFRDYSASSNSTALKRELKKTFVFFILFTSASMLAYTIMPSFTVQTIFERGKFSEHATALTSSALFYFSFGLPFIIIHAIQTRILLVWRQELFLLKASIVTITVKIVLSYLFVKTMNHNGLALATSIAYLVTVLVLVVKLKIEYHLNKIKN